MKRTVDVDKTYKCNTKKAIDKFFKAYPELDYWKEQLEYMNENNVEHEIPTYNGKLIEEWNYSIWLIKIDDNTTYIAIIERV